MRVEVERPEEMNMLGLFLGSALEERVERLGGVRGDIAMTGGAMSVTLSFEPERVVVRKGVLGRPRAHLKGSLEGLVELARGRAAAPLLRRQVRVSGNPLAALPLARVFR